MTESGGLGYDTDWGALPGGFLKGGHAYFKGCHQTFANGDVLPYGTKGTVVGTGSSDEKLAVRFDGTEVTVNVKVEELSTGEPSKSFAGGFELNDTVYFTGTSQDVGGDQLRRGGPGVVVGPSGAKVAVHFDGVKTVINCDIAQISREAPSSALPGGHSEGDQVYFAGQGQEIEGDMLEYGRPGRVVGPSGEKLAVRFEGVKIPVNCLVTQISRDPPGALPGGFAVNQVVYYTGTSQFLDNGLNFGDQLVYGGKGSVVGPASEGKICLKFDDNSIPVNCFLKDVSADKPPEVLAGGYRVNDEVKFTGKSQSFANGDKLDNGTGGCVVGPGGEGKVAVKFSGNQVLLNVSPECLSKFNCLACER